MSFSPLCARVIPTHTYTCPQAHASAMLSLFLYLHPCRMYSGCHGAAMVTSLGASPPSLPQFSLLFTQREPRPISLDVSRARTLPNVSPFIPDSRVHCHSHYVAVKKKNEYRTVRRSAEATMTQFFVQIPQTFNASRCCSDVLLPSALVNILSPASFARLHPLSSFHSWH